MRGRRAFVLALHVVPAAARHETPASDAAVQTAAGALVDVVEVRHAKVMAELVRNRAHRMSVSRSTRALELAEDGVTPISDVDPVDDWRAVPRVPLDILYQTPQFTPDERPPLPAAITVTWSSFGSRRLFRFV